MVTSKLYIEWFAYNNSSVLVYDGNLWGTLTNNFNNSPIMSANKTGLLRPSSLDFMASTLVSYNKNEFNKRPRRRSTNCSRCDYTSDPYYSCSVCDLDFCITCTGISHMMHRVLQEDKKKILCTHVKNVNGIFPPLVG